MDSIRGQAGHTECTVVQRGLKYKFTLVELIQAQCVHSTTNVCMYCQVEQHLCVFVYNTVPLVLRALLSVQLYKGKLKYKCTSVELIQAQCVHRTTNVFMYSQVAVSYTHLTLPTN